VNTLQASRRGFLSNLAILTAGVAIGGNTSAFLTVKHNDAPSLESIWKSFCKSRLATPFSGAIENRKEIDACKGHEHREGNVMYFPGDELIAQPIWIYWAANKNKPSDVIINFYKEGVVIGTLNQFEIKALCATKGEVKRLTAFFQVNNDGARLYTAQTTVGANNHITTQFAVLKSASVLV
jgi:hypothetical protein